MLFYTKLELTKTGGGRMQSKYEQLELYFRAVPAKTRGDYAIVC